MDAVSTQPRAFKRATAWLRWALILLLGEKVVQHVVVTAAFYTDAGGIRSTVVVNPDVLMVAGAIVGALFALCLWGALARKSWSTWLAVALSAFDIVGEFVAQGTVGITITVSFLVALLLLVLALATLRRGGA